MVYGPIPTPSPGFWDLGILATGHYGVAQLSVSPGFHGTGEKSINSEKFRLILGPKVCISMLWISKSQSFGMNKRPCLKSELSMAGAGYGVQPSDFA